MTKEHNQKMIKARMGKSSKAIKEKELANEIIRIVCDYYDVDVFEQTHRHEISIPRYISVYLIREFTKNVSYDYLGKLFNRDHSGFVTSVSKFKDSLYFDKVRKAEVEDLNTLIKLSKYYSKNILKKRFMLNILNFLDTLNVSQIEMFYNSLTSVKSKNIEVIYEEVK